MHFTLELSGQVAFLHGTLQILDEKAAFPVNKVKIDCNQGRGFCTLDEVDLKFPSRRDFSPSFTVFWTDPLHYRITRWTKDLIEANYEVSAKQCRNTKLQLNFKAKEYYMITTNAGEQCEVLGVKFDKLKKPRISKIMDGEDLIQAEFDAFRKKQYEFLASGYRKRVEDAVKKAKAASR